jgi:hypothetical protein
MPTVIDGAYVIERGPPRVIGQQSLIVACELRCGRQAAGHGERVMSL